MKSFIKKYLKVVISLVLAVVLSIILFLSLGEKPSTAVSGHGTSHSSGGSHSSSRSSSRSSYRSSSISSSGSSSSPSSVASAIVGLVFLGGFGLVFVILIAYATTKRSPITADKPINDENVLNKIKEHLPDFDKVKYKEQTFKIFCDVQDAWMNSKIVDVKDIITDELYNMYDSQLDVMDVKGEQNIMKDISLHDFYLKAVSVQNDTITITSRYVISHYDYIADKETKKCIRGESNRKMKVNYDIKYRMTLNDNKVVTKCPNCGADLDINSSGVCSYCRSKVFSETSNWVLSEIQVINQQYI